MNNTTVHQTPPNLQERFAERPQKINSLDGLREIQIELTSYCNADCPFCINRASFAAEARLTGGLPTETLLKVLEWLASWNIPRIRFTGGEPLLRKDLFILSKHAKRLGMQIILNTNGRLVQKYADEIISNFDVVLLSMVSADPIQTDTIMRDSGAHIAKLKALEILVPKMPVWVSSVISSTFVSEFEDLWSLLQKLGVGYWVLLRSEPNGTDLLDYVLEKEILSTLVDKIACLPNNVSPIIGFGNAVPVCSVTSQLDLMTKLVRDGDGGTVSEGKSKLVIDPYGNVLVHYGVPQPVGKIFDKLDEIWTSDTVLSLRNGDLLPIACKDCEFLSVCRGGSRLAAKSSSGSLSAKDPLMTK